MILKNDKEGNIISIWILNFIKLKKVSMELPVRLTAQ